MATYRRETRVDAPFESVWEFHATTDGLEALTPGFLNLEIESVTGADGAPDPDVLAAGSTVELSVRPFGVGPRRGWTTRIVERTEGDAAGSFRDVMEDGPFPQWEHTHRFAADGEGTRIVDRVTYDLPCGVLGRAVSPLGWVGFEPMFRERHRRTRLLLE